MPAPRRWLAAAGRARSTCTGCCRCRPRSWQLGPNDPAALAWLMQHWGITDRLRQVVRRPQPGIGRRLPAGHAVIGYGFFTAGDTPLLAIERIARDWPALQFHLTPRPPD